jgi:opacity protein-like surface antigen
LTNQDYLQYASSEEFVKSVVANRKVDYQKLINAIPSHPVPNYFFKNLGSMHFSDYSNAWGVAEPSFSNGSAYGDLDNDGDLDLVVNNVNMPAFIYKNNTDQLMSQNHFLKFDLKGAGKNTEAVGSKVTLYAGGKTFYLEQMPMRGFESTVDPRLNFGLGEISMVDKVVIEWPYGTVTTMDSVKVDQTVKLTESSSSPKEPESKTKEKLLFEELKISTMGIDFKHLENNFVDFDRDRLIYHMVSTEGPKLSIEDYNKDGLHDFYIGGAKDQAGELYQQQPGMKFKKKKQRSFENDKASEDIGAGFFDADGDGDLDLYVCSGGSEFTSNSTEYIDRLYINDGKENYLKSNQVLPAGKLESTSCVKYADFDNDGDMDLFVGIRLEPFRYGYPMNGYILSNDGKGNFKNITSEVAPQLLNVGMITDAAWLDADADKDLDLVVVGEWMPVTLFINTNGKFSNQTLQSGLGKSNGWWNTLTVSDIDGDGDLDLIGGNHGLNSRFRASEKKPATMFVNDFDKNGSVEQIICTYNGDKSYPMVLRHDLIQQLPGLKKKFLKYESYKEATITDIFDPDQLADAIELKAYQFASGVFVNDGKGHFTFSQLPVEAQFSPMYSILANDFDADGKMDLLMGGNLYRVKPEVGRYDASFGVFMKGDGKGGFKTIRPKDCGFFVDGEIRDIKTIRIGNLDCVLVARNNDAPVLFKVNR